MKLYLWWKMMLRPEDFDARDAAELLFLTRTGYRSQLLPCRPAAGVPSEK